MPEYQCATAQFRHQQLQVWRYDPRRKFGQDVFQQNGSFGGYGSRRSGGHIADHIAKKADSGVEVLAQNVERISFIVQYVTDPLW